jgi:hypothetical protein
MKKLISLATAAIASAAFFAAPASAQALPGLYRLGSESVHIDQMRRLQQRDASTLRVWTTDDHTKYTDYTNTTTLNLIKLRGDFATRWAQIGAGEHWVQLGLTNKIRCNNVGGGTTISYPTMAQNVFVQLSDSCALANDLANRAQQ